MTLGDLVVIALLIGAPIWAAMALITDFREARGLWAPPSGLLIWVFWTLMSALCIYLAAPVSLRYLRSEETARLGRLGEVQERLIGIFGLEVCLAMGVILGLAIRGVAKGVANAQRD